MLFLNIKNGTEWSISDKEHINRLLKDKNYSVIEKEEIKTDIVTLSYSELQGIAKEKGLKYNNVKKEELIKSLEEGE